MVVLPFITCTASKSPVCPRAKEDDLSSSCMSSSYLDIEDKQTDRILERKLSKRVPPRNLIILKAIIHAQPLKPPVENTGFTLAWTEYGWWPQIPAILKTYFRSTGSEIQDECSKWKAIGGLVAISPDSRPDLQHSVFHIILGNAVPHLNGRHGSRHQ
ncbi:hypothetical protein APHAL10511_000367 [Amanita phalloides]|nr:hypothetical protein APHAL10511_000367 [Amanita phalloides]